MKLTLTNGLTTTAFIQMHVQLSIYFDGAQGIWRKEPRADIFLLLGPNSDGILSPSMTMTGIADRSFILVNNSSRFAKGIVANIVQPVQPPSQSPAQTQVPAPFVNNKPVYDMNVHMLREDVTYTFPTTWKVYDDKYLSFDSLVIDDRIIYLYLGTPGGVQILLIKDKWDSAGSDRYKNRFDTPGGPTITFLSAATYLEAKDGIQNVYIYKNVTNNDYTSVRYSLSPPPTPPSAAPSPARPYAIPTMVVTPAMLRFDPPVQPDDFVTIKLTDAYSVSWFESSRLAIALNQSSRDAIALFFKDENTYELYQETDKNKRTTARVLGDPLAITFMNITQQPIGLIGVSVLRLRNVPAPYRSPSPYFAPSPSQVQIQSPSPYSAPSPSRVPIYSPSPSPYFSPAPSGPTINPPMNVVLDYGTPIATQVRNGETINIKLPSETRYADYPGNTISLIFSDAAQIDLVKPSNVDVIRETNPINGYFSYLYLSEAGVLKVTVTAAVGVWLEQVLISACDNANCTP